MVYIYLKLTKVREIIEMSNFSVACHEATTGDVRERGGDVGKRGQAVHPWRAHLENSLVQFWIRVTPTFVTLSIWREFEK